MCLAGRLDMVAYGVPIGFFLYEKTEWTGHDMLMLGNKSKIEWVEKDGWKKA